MNDYASESLLGHIDTKSNNIKRSRIKKMVQILPFLFLLCFLVSFVLCARIDTEELSNISQVASSSQPVTASEQKCFYYIMKELVYYNTNISTTWTYECRNNNCQRRRARVGENTITTLETCNMMCTLPSLWPMPKSIKLNNKASSMFNKNQMVPRFEAPSAIKRDLKVAFRIFKHNLPSPKDNRSDDPGTKQIRVAITVGSDERRINLSTNEGYSLSVQLSSNNSIVANITAPTYFGARHALETLSQLVWLDTNINELMIFHGVVIEDAPAFPYRGVMVDTARNFFAIKSLRKVVDGMSASKLNVIHLHLTDSVSFPVLLPTIPQLGEYGAYGPDKTYTAADIKGLIEYARIRGIRTILEVDSPSHVNEGWNYFNRGDDKLVICGESNVIGGQLNPDNPNTLKVLKKVYEGLIELGTDEEIFHIGGDEVNLDCYKNTKASRKFEDIYELWANFTNNIFETVVDANAEKPPKNLVVWSSPLTSSYLKSLNYSGNIVVQFWYGELKPIVENGNRIIFSTVGKWYLDCGFGSWHPDENSGSCDPYTPWQTFYKYQPWIEYSVSKDQVLGGESCLWTEQVDESTLETRLWPRTAAFAERVWSDPDMSLFDTYDVSTRISTHRGRLMERGFDVAAIWPFWCTQNPGKC